MAGPNAPYTNLDSDQVLKQSFDETNDRLRVDAQVTAVVPGPFEVIINDTTDSIAIGDGTGNKWLINPDRSGNVRTMNTLITNPFDFISATYPNATTEVYSYKLGGSSGSLVGTITVVYQDATKNLITSVAKT
jgi:hypothetical protein